MQTNKRIITVALDNVKCYKENKTEWGNDSILLGWSRRASLRSRHWSWAWLRTVIISFPCPHPEDTLATSDYFLSQSCTFLPLCFWSTCLFLWPASLCRPSSSSASPGEMDSAARNSSSLPPMARLCHSQTHCVLFAFLWFLPAACDFSLICLCILDSCTVLGTQNVCGVDLNIKLPEMIMWFCQEPA